MWTNINPDVVGYCIIGVVWLGFLIALAKLEHK